VMILLFLFIGLAIGWIARGTNEYWKGKVEEHESHIDYEIVITDSLVDFVKGELNFSPACTACFHNATKEQARSLLKKIQAFVDLEALGNGKRNRKEIL